MSVRSRRSAGGSAASGGRGDRVGSPGRGRGCAAGTIPYAVGAVPGVREVVRPNARPVRTAARGRAVGRAAGGDRGADTAVQVPGDRVPCGHLRRAGSGTDPAARPAHACPARPIAGTSKGPIRGSVRLGPVVVGTVTRSGRRRAAARGRTVSGSSSAPGRRRSSVRGPRGWRRRTRGPAVRCRRSRGRRR